MANSQPTERQTDIQFRQLLEEAVSKPGTLMKEYSLFWNYSLGNQILALFQANRRSIIIADSGLWSAYGEDGALVSNGSDFRRLESFITGRYQG